MLAEARPNLGRVLPRLSTVIDLAKEHGVTLPAYTESELRKLVFKESYASLEEYLKGFQYTTAVMQTASALERVAYEFACDNYDEGEVLRKREIPVLPIPGLCEGRRPNTLTRARFA